MSAEYVLNKEIADFLREGIEAGSMTGVPKDLPVRQERDVDERSRPCVVVHSEAGENRHPKLVERDLMIDVLTQRDDTPGEDVSSWVAELRAYLAVRMMDFCERLHAKGWLVKTWVQITDTAEEDGDRGWREGTSYKVVVMQA